MFNAPNITSQVYLGEKANLVGMNTCAVLYGGPAFVFVHPALQFVIPGVIVILFFQCIGALLSPVNRTRREIKWLLVTHTVAIFLFVTVFTALNLDTLSTSYVDNREAHGTVKLPGPLGYQWTTYSTPRGVVVTFMFLLNNWLTGGLFVSYISNSVVQVSNVGHTSSSIVAMLFMP